MKNIGILTSGGDAPGMNPAIRAAVRTAIYLGYRIYGINDGFAGLIEGDIFEMSLSSVADIIHRGGTMLGTSRSDEFKTEEGLQKALEVIEKFKLDCIIVLGGDGSMMGANSLAKAGLRTYCIPCTIDNDMGYTEFTIGFFTAVETIVDATVKIRDTSSSHERASVIEVMGRKCGDLAVYAGVAAGAENIVVPEKEYELKPLVDKVIQGKNRGKRHHIILVTEDTVPPYELAEAIEKETGVVTRVTILGYIQRGGSPSINDRLMASLMGEQVIRLLAAGHESAAVGIKGNELFCLDIESAIAVPNELNNRLYETLKVISI